MTELEHSNPAPASGRGLWVPAPTRRSLVRAGAWSAPALVVAAAAPPAAAASRAVTIGGTIQETEIQDRSDPNNPIYSWSFLLDSLTIGTTGGVVSANELTLTVAFIGNDVIYPVMPDGVALTANGVPPGLVDTTPTGSPTLTFSNAADITPAQPLVLPTRVWFLSTEYAAPLQGTFSLTVTILGATSAATLALEVPTHRKVTFNPGGSAVTTDNGQALLSLSGASITIDDLSDTNDPQKALAVRARYATSSGSEDLRIERVLSSHNWFGPLPGANDMIPEWFVELNPSGGITVHLDDGPWLRTVQAVPQLPAGRFELSFWLMDAFDFWRDSWIQPWTPSS